MLENFNGRDSAKLGPSRALPIISNSNLRCNSKYKRSKFTTIGSQSRFGSSNSREDLTNVGPGSYHISREMSPKTSFGKAVRKFTLEKPYI